MPVRSCEITSVLIRKTSMVIGAIVAVTTLSGCNRNDSASDKSAYDRLAKDVRVVLCGEGTISKRSATLAKIVENPMFNDRDTAADPIIEAGDQVTRDRCERSRATSTSAR